MAVVKRVKMNESSGGAALGVEGSVVELGFFWCWGLNEAKKKTTEKNGEIIIVSGWIVGKVGWIV